MQFNENERIHQAAHDLAMEYVRKRISGNSDLKSYTPRNIPKHTKKSVNIFLSFRKTLDYCNVAQPTLY